MSHTFFCSILILLLLSGCKPSESPKDDTLITIIPNLGSAVSSLFPYIDTIVTVPLEITEQSLIQHILKMLVLPNGNLLISSQGKILLFNPEGQFLFQIGRTGRGPEEYTSLEDFCLSQEGKELWILSGEKIVMYNTENGKFLRSVTPNKPAHCPYFNGIASGSDRSIFLYSCNMNAEVPFGEEYPCLIYYNKNGKLLQGFLPQKDYGISMALITQSYDNRYILRPQDNNNICYYLSDSLPIAQIRIDFGKKTIPNRYSPDLQTYLRADYYKMPIYFHDTREHLFFTFCGPEAREYYCLHSFGQNKNISWQRQGKDTEALFQIVSSDAEFFYGLYTDYRTREELPLQETDLLKQAIIQKNSIQLTEDMNPVLVKIRFKTKL